MSASRFPCSFVVGAEGEVWFWGSRFRFSVVRVPSSTAVGKARRVVVVVVVVVAAAAAAGTL
jgi:hypothetical protein